jgi:hypothetical protein
MKILVKCYFFEIKKFRNDFNHIKTQNEENFKKK